jgi:hypothetical protein
MAAAIAAAAVGDHAQRRPEVHRGAMTSTSVAIVVMVLLLATAVCVADARPTLAVAPAEPAGGGFFAMFMAVDFSEGSAVIVKF